MHMIEFDTAKAEAFAGRLLTVLNDGALAVMISIGHRTGLFDSLGSLPPVTSAELAAATGLNERYVREWLAALVPGLDDALEQGIDVLDVGCGRGKALLSLARTFPRSRFTGYELSMETTAATEAEAREHGLDKLRFVAQDAARFDAPASFDLICAFDAIHDQAEPARVLRNIRRALRPGGTFLMQDIRASSELHKNLEHPAAPLLYTISTVHCMSVSLSAGGAGLGTMWGEELALSMLAEAGFGTVEVRQLPQDFLNNYYIARA